MGIEVLEHVELYRDPERFCGNPNLTRLRNGQLLLGFRWAEGKLGGDWDPSLRPVQMTGDTVEELTRVQPQVIHDADGTLTPYFKQLSDESLLCAVNRWRLVSEEEAAKYPGRGRHDDEPGSHALLAPILI